MNRPVILIGFMGCGKSTIGKSLSYKLRIPLIDTDHLIENKEGMKISEIFERYGEEHFRELESNHLINIMSMRQDHVISTGGGLPLREINRNILNEGKKMGRIIYLISDPETIYERVKNNKDRPLLNCEDPLTRIQTMLKERDPIYRECADICIDTAGKSAAENAEEIIRSLER